LKSVRHTAGELANDFELLGLAQPFLGMSAIGHIGDDPGQAGGLAVLVPVKAPFGDDPADTVVGPDDPAFEPKSSGLHRLSEGRLKNLLILWQHVLFRDCADYYAAFVIDPDGYRIEVLFGRE
jgi:hypothetical protein